jgi:hypothetical protein
MEHFGGKIFKSVFLSGVIFFKIHEQIRLFSDPFSICIPGGQFGQAVLAEFFDLDTSGKFRKIISIPFDLLPSLLETLKEMPWVLPAYQADGPEFFKRLLRKLGIAPAR